MPIDKRKFFIIDDWDVECNVPLKHYSKYITAIDDLDFDKTIAIVKNEEQYVKLKNTRTAFLKVFVGERDDDTMKAQITGFIASQGLDKLETVRLEHNGMEYHTISFGTPIKVQGVYFTEDVGYQRKWMTNLFYEKFKKYLLWGNKEDFDLAYTCVADEWYLKNYGQEAVNKMKTNFKENFVDKYEFGKSLLCATW